MGEVRKKGFHQGGIELFYRSIESIIESIKDAIYQIRVFREHGTTWGEDRESFEENRLSTIEDKLIELTILIEEMEDLQQYGE